MKIYMKNAINKKKIVLLALLASLALMLSLIESWLQLPIGIPGIKLELANIITIILLIFFSLSDAVIIILIRCIFSSLFMGGPVIFMVSICGGIVSATIMWILLKTMQKWLSLVGISIAGSVAHNTAQMLVACFIVNDLIVVTHMPVILLFGIIMGGFTGYCCEFLVKAIKKLNIIANIS